MSIEREANSQYVGYPVERRLFPKPSIFNKGDQVKALIGPAEGRIGAVAVELNRNYLDFERRVPVNSVGVLFTEPANLIPALIEIIQEADYEALMTKVIRWFPDPSQLELIARSPKHQE